MNYSEYFSIVDYYKLFVQPINKKYFTKNDKMMVCPLHDDVNPSMGIIKGSNGKELYHCFGCNSWGDIVDLHIKVSRRLKKRYLDRESALRELCNMFGVDYNAIKSKEQADVLDKDVRVDSAMSAKEQEFDYADFRNMITDGKLQRKRISYFNTLMIMMVSSLKDNKKDDSETQGDGS